MSEEAWIAACEEINETLATTAGIEMGSVLVRMGEYADAVNLLVADIEARRATAQAWLEDLQDAVAEYREGAEGRIPDLQACVAAIREAVGILTRDLTRVRDSIHATAREAIAHLDQVRPAVVSCVAGVASARNDASRALSDAGTTVRGLEGSVVEAGARARGAVRTLQAATVEASLVAHEGTHQVVEDLNLIAQNAPGRSLDSAANACEVALKLRAATAPAVDGLVEGVAPLLFELCADTLEAREALLSSTAVVGERGEELGVLLAGTSEWLAMGRADLASRLETLEAARAVAAKQIGYGREAAAIIGADWENPQ